jgi:hypothetical protein
MEQHGASTRQMVTYYGDVVKTLGGYDNTLDFARLFTVPVQAAALHFPILMVLKSLTPLLTGWKR